MERTLILIKPDAIRKKLTGFILDRFESMGLKMIAAKVTRVDEEMIRAHYAHLAGEPFLPQVINFMLGRENGLETPHLYAFIYTGEDAVQKVRAVTGATNPLEAAPSTLRGQFGRTKEGGAIQNCLHCSATPGEAEQEIKLWFKPGEILELSDENK